MGVVALLSPDLRGRRMEGCGFELTISYDYDLFPFFGSENICGFVRAANCPCIVDDSDIFFFPFLTEILADDFDCDFTKIRQYIRWIERKRKRLSH